MKAKMVSGLWITIFGLFFARFFEHLAAKTTKITEMNKMQR